MRKVALWARAPFGVGLTLALLLAMVSLGLQVKGIAQVPVTGGLGPEYGAPPHATFVPLRENFVEQVVGDAGVLGVVGGADPPRAPARTHPGAEVVEHEMTNDNRAQAYRVGRIPFTARTSTEHASRESDEPSDCAPVGGTVWYRYTPAASTAIVVTTAAATPVGLAVYPGDSSRALGCASDPDGRSKLAFQAVRGASYHFQVTMQVGGPLVFSLDLEPSTFGVSVDEAGATVGATYDYGYPKVSADGRWVAFVSPSPRLDRRCRVGRDGSAPCARGQVYVRDLLNGSTELVSVTADGGIPNGPSAAPSISADGRYISWASLGDNVVPGEDLGGEWDVFLRDRVKKMTTRVTVHPDGAEMNGLGSSISANGRYIAFEGDFEERRSTYDNRWIFDIYLKDMETGAVTLVSRAGNGARADHHSIAPILSANGRFVVFMTKATNLGESTAVDGAFNKTGVDQHKLYTFDRRTGTLSPECVAEDGKTLANDQCWGQAISRDGRYTVFWSLATNLIDGLPTPSGANQFLYAYRRDRITGDLDLVTVTDDGRPQPEVWRRNVPFRAKRNVTSSISADGSIVAFESDVELVAGDDNGTRDAYIRDFTRRKTIRVSESSSGTDSEGVSEFTSVSGDGDVVAFLSEAATLVAEDVSPGWDVFARTWRTL